LNLRGAALGCVALSVFADGACGDSTVDVFDPDLGLLAHWALDESQAGSVVLDSSGFGLDGTVSSGPPVPTLDIPPVHFPDPHSLSFNGQDEYVVFGNPPILNLGGPISVAAWVRPTRTDGYRDIVAHGYTPDKAEDLALRIESGTYDFTYWNGQDHHGVATVPPSDVGAWVHLASSTAARIASTGMGSWPRPRPTPPHHPRTSMLCGRSGRARPNQTLARGSLKAR
jgi:hypothetical protein